MKGQRREPSNLALSCSFQDEIYDKNMFDSTLESALKFQTENRHVESKFA